MNELQFEYDGIKHRRAPNKAEIRVIRLAGLMFLITSIDDLFFKDGKLTSWELIINGGLFVIGICYLFFARKFFSMSGATKKFIKVDTESIEWQLDTKTKVGKIQLSDIESIKEYVGMLQLKTHANGSYVIHTYKIASEKKHLEFIDFIRNLKTKL